MKAVTVMKALETEILRTGNIKVLLTDQGGEFCAQLNDMLCAFYGYRHQFIHKGNPRANGRVERFNQTLINYLAKAKLDDLWREDWEPVVEALAAHYNASYNRTICMTPFFAYFSRESTLGYRDRFKVVKGNDFLAPWEINAGS